MARATMEATDTTCSLSNCLWGGSGMVSVHTTDSMTESFSRSTAEPENTPWVVAAMTRRAPLAASRSAAATMVPPVSIMSSTSTQVRPATSPTISLASTRFFSSLARRLWTMARSACRTLV